MVLGVEKNSCLGFPSWGSRVRDSYPAPIKSRGYSIFAIAPFSLCARSAQPKSKNILRAAVKVKPTILNYPLVFNIPRLWF